MNLRNAKEYFQEHLAVGDYYSQSRSVAGEWLGKGAYSLGLSGAVKADDFVAMCDNLNPRTGQKLTVRRKTTRIERHADGTTSEVANRRILRLGNFSAQVGVHRRAGRWRRKNCPSP